MTLLLGPCPVSKNIHLREGKRFLLHMNVRQGSVCPMLKEWFPDFAQEKRSAEYSETGGITDYGDALVYMIEAN